MHSNPGPFFASAGQFPYGAMRCPSGEAMADKKACPVDSVCSRAGTGARPYPCGCGKTLIENVTGRIGPPLPVWVRFRFGPGCIATR